VVERCGGGYLANHLTVLGGGKADVMASNNGAACITEYGVQTANSKTILTVTLDLAEAERTLDMIGEGFLLKRTVRYSAWTAVDEPADLGSEPVQASSSS
jgi:hypothetical protein